MLKLSVNLHMLLQFPSYYTADLLHNQGIWLTMYTTWQPERILSNAMLLCTHVLNHASLAWLGLGIMRS